MPRVPTTEQHETRSRPRRIGFDRGVPRRWSPVTRNLWIVLVEGPESVTSASVGDAITTG